MKGMDAVFVQLCREKFQFLVDEFGFRRVDAATRPGPGRVLYVSATAGVDADYDVRDGYIGVSLMRLVNGEPPEYDDLLNRKPLWTLVRLRAPAAERTLGSGVRTEAQAAAALDAAASLMKTYAADVLSGDFSVFPELERVRAADARGAAPDSAGGDASTPT